jgi:signal transduction histidine kinase
VSEHLFSLVERAPLTGWHAVSAGLLGLLAVAVIGAIDVASGASVTLGAFYLVPVMVASVLCGSRFAVGVAAGAAGTWVAADAVVAGHGPGTTIVLTNLVLRFAMFAVVILLLSTMQYALRRAQASDRRSHEFLAFAAHQLRTPTTTVSTAAQQLLAEGTPLDQEDLLMRVVYRPSGSCAW